MCHLSAGLYIMTTTSIMRNICSVSSFVEMLVYVYGNIKTNLQI